MLILYSYFYLKQRANKFSFPLLGFVIFVAYYFLWEKFLFLRVTIRSFSFARKLISALIYRRGCVNTYDAIGWYSKTQSKVHCVGTYSYLTPCPSILPTFPLYTLNLKSDRQSTWWPYIRIINLTIALHGGRRQWAIYYTSTQSFKIKFSYSLT